MGGYRYKAFISYSHADQKWATWLHRSLESYRFPDPVRAKHHLPDRSLAPVFRDREELASSSDLGESILAALQQSANMIVICSESAANSRWVNEEVVRFQALGKGNRIFTCIVDGYAPDVFPPALRTGNEPLACDVRREADGRHNALLKLVAGLVNIDYNELRQREVSKRHRRMALISGVSVIGMLVMTAIAGFAVVSQQQAVTARNEADAQRARAESSARTANEVTEFLIGLFNTADPTQAPGSDVTAIQILDRGADRISRELAGEPAVRSRLEVALGRIYGELGDLDKARGLLEQGLAEKEATFGPKHVETADALDRLGLVYWQQSLLDESIGLYERALEIWRAHSGTDLAEARTLDNLGAVLSEKGRYADSQAAFEQALELRRRGLGSDHSDVAMTLNNLANLISILGDDQRALPMQEEVLEIWERAHGSEHPWVAAATNNLAFTYKMLGRYDESEKLYLRSIATTRNVLGEDHPVLGNRINALGGLYATVGRLEEAERYYRDGLEATERALGPNHPDLGYGLGSLGNLFLTLERNREAEPLFRRQLALWEQHYDPEHVDIAYPLSSLARMYEQRGDYDLARPLLERALVIRQKNMVPDAPELKLVLQRYEELTARLDSNATTD